MASVAAQRQTLCAEVSAQRSEAQRKCELLRGTKRRI